MIHVHIATPPKHTYCTLQPQKCTYTVYTPEFLIDPSILNSNSVKYTLIYCTLQTSNAHLYTLDCSLKHTDLCTVDCIFKKHIYIHVFYTVTSDTHLYIVHCVLKCTYIQYSVATNAHLDIFLLSVKWVLPSTINIYMAMY